MNASEADSSAQSKPGESVEDELTRFFAETSANDAKHKAVSVPVKGSILNFFKPPANKEQPTAAAAQAPKSAARPVKPMKHFMAPNPKAKSPTRLVEWSCKSCTFDNTRQMSGSGWLACEMCGATYIEEGTTSNQPEVAAPPSTSRRPKKVEPTKDKNTVVDLSCGDKRTGKRQQAPSEIIVLDLDEPSSRAAATPRVAKKQRSSISESDVIEIDNDCKPKAKRKASEVSVIDVDAPVSRSVVTPASQPRKRVSSSILNFVVSKNSGRVSVHSAQTGDSFHYNFDIDLLITEVTADLLLSAEVKRSSSKAFGVAEKDIKFREDAVKRGKPPRVSTPFLLFHGQLSAHQFRSPLLYFISRS